MENTIELTQPLKRSKEEIRQYIEQWQQSGKNKTIFCLENNLNYLTFIGWTNPKKKKKKKETLSDESGFVPLKISDASGSLYAEIHLADGTKVCLHQSVPALYLRSLIR